MRSEIASNKGSSSVETVQARLRRSCHPSHVRLNQHALLAGLTGAEYPLSSYRAVLVAYYHLYQNLEARIEQYMQSAQLPLDYGSRLKLPWLREDLLFLNVNPQSELPRQPIDFPEIENPGQLIGVLYPIEGACLGGQVVARHLAGNLGLSAGFGARFFSGYGAETAAQWLVFCQFAETIQNDPQLCHAAVETALQAFSKFEEVLDDYQRN